MESEGNSLAWKKGRFSGDFRRDAHKIGMGRGDQLAVVRPHHVAL